MDVVDTTFETEVMVRSEEIPVVVDLWAPWCGPCKSLGPLLEKVVGENFGNVVLAKVDIDKNPSIAQAFQVQSIPAVFAIRNREVVSSFVGAQGEEVIRKFVTDLLPDEIGDAISELLEAGDENSLRSAVSMQPDHIEAVCALAELLILNDSQKEKNEAISLLESIPENPETRRLLVVARVEKPDDIEAELANLLNNVDDESARQRYLDLLEVLGPEDPRTSDWRQRLTSALF
tara:strand:- start:280 stop:978 length:699 start_codon:yes stop_codon:yes gene_type:complete